MGTKILCSVVGSVKQIKNLLLCSTKKWKVYVLRVVCKLFAKIGMDNYSFLGYRLPVLVGSLSSHRQQKTKLTALAFLARYPDFSSVFYTKPFTKCSPKPLPFSLAVPLVVKYCVENSGGIRPVCCGGSRHSNQNGVSR